MIYSAVFYIIHLHGYFVPAIVLFIDSVDRSVSSWTFTLSW